MSSQKRTIGQRVNGWLQEPPGQQFVAGKWRFWWPTVTGFTLLNAILTAMVFRSGDTLQNYMGAILVGVGGLLAWLCVGALHYSDSPDRQLARGVSALDSVTLIFVIAHFCGLLWIYGHLYTLQSAEAKYEAAAEKYNADARQLQADNVKIAASAERIAQETTKAERLRNDTAYQTRKAAEAGARLLGQRRPAQVAPAPALFTGPIELERPTKPAESSTEFLTAWDFWIRLTNFGELLLAAITLIFVRNQSAATNGMRPAYEQEEFPGELDADLVQSDRTGRRFDRTRKSDSGRQSPVSGDSAARKEALKLLREHLKQIAFYHPGLWFKADLIRGGVTIRLFKKDHGHEIMVARTDQSDRLLAAIERPDFRERLLGELIYQGFPLNRVTG
jgi:hypothetical protein